MDTKKYILGGGISGLIFAYYNKDFAIITPDIGGILKTKFISATVLLHKDENTIAMLKELDLPFDFVRHEIRYLTEAGFTKEISGKDRILMVKKKMTEANKLPKLEDVEVKDINLSTETNFIELVSVKSTDLIDVLYNKVKDRVIFDEVIYLDDSEIKLKSNNIISFDYLISTIPANFFFKLRKESIDLKSKSITMVLSKELPEELKGKDFDLVYNNRIDKLWSRMNKNGDEYLYEFTGIVTEENAKQLFNDNISKYYIKHDGVIESCELPVFDNITYLGRFALWQHKFKIHDAIKIAKEFRK